MFDWFTKKPNVIFILIDMFRNDWRDRYPIFKTLSERGTVFNRMMSYAPYTIASMHAYMTGIYGNHNGVDGYYKSEKFEKDRIVTLAQYLQRNGYHTLADFFNKVMIPCQGFDELLLHDEAKDNFLVRHPELLDRLRAQAKPFFAYLHYPTIHRDIVKNVIKYFDENDERYFGKIEENSRRYAGYVAEAVTYLEHMHAYLEKNNLYDNSLVIVMADHGCGLGERPGEKAYGIFTYEYSIKVWAYLMASPRVKPGQAVDAIVRTVDVMPTILDFLDIKIDKKYMQPDGRSLLPALRGEPIADRLAFSETGGVDGPHPSPYEPNVKCIRDGDWKLIYNLATKQKELYNLNTDPDEKDNRIGREPAIEQDLWQKLIKS